MKMSPLRNLWNLAYLFKRPPWDTGITPPEVVEVVESGQIHPGLALDIGCGTGTNAIYLAKHGFQAQGIDISSLAIFKARRKAKRQGVSVAFMSGNILNLRTTNTLAITLPVDFVLDIGCLHSFAADKRPSYGAMLQRALCNGGFYMLYAWGPRKMPIGPFGISPTEVQSTIGQSFHMISIREGQEFGAPSYWYLFVRT